MTKIHNPSIRRMQVFQREPQKLYDPSVCILDCDSPSYPPEEDEYRQCGCAACDSYLERMKEKRS